MFLCLHNYIAVSFYSLDNLIQEEIGEMYEYFNKDVSDDITFNEVKIYAETMNNDHIDILLKYALRYCNFDENGLINFNAIFNKLRLAENADDLECLFKIFDENSDSFFNTTELRNVINYVKYWSITTNEASNIIKSVIGYDNHKINYDEFLKIMKNI